MPDPTFTAPPTAPSRSDAPAVFVARADAFVAWFATLYTELVAFVVWVNAAGASLVEAVADGIAAIDARVASAGFKGTSTTSRAIGTGSKAFVTQAGLSFAPGSIVIVADAAAPTVNYLFGNVSAYDALTGDLTVEVTSATGSGTKASWVISISGPQGNLTKASASDIRNGTNDNSYVTSKGLGDAEAWVDLGNVSGTVTLDLKAGRNFKMTATGNVTLADPTNKWDGFVGIVKVKQDATGGRTIATNSAIKKTQALTLSTGANAVDQLTLWCDGTEANISPLLKAFA